MKKREKLKKNVDKSRPRRYSENQMNGKALNELIGGLTISEIYSNPTNRKNEGGNDDSTPGWAPTAIYTYVITQGNGPGTMTNPQGTLTLEPVMQGPPDHIGWEDNPGMGNNV